MKIRLWRPSPVGSSVPPEVMELTVDVESCVETAAWYGDELYVYSGDTFVDHKPVRSFCLVPRDSQLHLGGEATPVSWAQIARESR